MVRAVRFILPFSHHISACDELRERGEILGVVMSPVAREGNQPFEVVGVRAICCTPTDAPSMDPSTVLLPEVSEICLVGNGKDPAADDKVTTGVVDMIE